MLSPQDSHTEACGLGLGEVHRSGRRRVGSCRPAAREPEAYKLAALQVVARLPCTTLSTIVFWTQVEICRSFGGCPEM